MDRTDCRSLSRPAGRCLQLVRPIRGKGGGSERRLMVGFGAILRCKYEAFQHWLLWLPSFFSLQINPIMNVIMMIPTKTLAPKIIHKHNFWGWDPWPLPPGEHLHHEDSRMKVVRRPLFLLSNHNGTMWWSSSHAKTNTYEKSKF